MYAQGLPVCKWCGRTVWYDMMYGSTHHYPRSFRDSFRIWHNASPDFGPEGGTA